MFHQVRIPEEDVDFRILWWPGGNISQPLAEYWITVTADDNEDKARPETLSTIRHKFYIDDCLKAVPSERQAICQVQELREICATGGFKLTKRTSNNFSILASVPAEERTKEVI